MNFDLAQIVGMFFVISFAGVTLFFLTKIFGENDDEQ